MGLFDGIKKALGPKSSPPEKGEQISYRYTPWQVHKGDVMRQHEWLDAATSQVKSVVQLRVSMDASTGMLITFPSIIVDPALTQDDGHLVMFFGTDDQSVTTGFVSANVQINKDGTNLIWVDDDARDAFLHVLRTCQTIRLIIAGDGPANSYVRVMANDGSYPALMDVHRRNAMNFGKLAGDALSRAERTIVESTNWEIDGSEVVRGFRYRNLETGREDKLLISVGVELGTLGALLHFFSLTVDPPIFNREQDARIMLQTRDGLVKSPRVDCMVALSDEDQTIVGNMSREGAGHLFKVLAAGKPTVLTVILPSRQEYVREFPNDGGYIRALRAREDVLLAEPLDLQGRIERLTGHKFEE